MIGLILGGINGILFSVLAERFIGHRYYRIIFLSNSLFVTLLVSEIIYFIPFKAYSSSPIRGIAVAIFPSVINAIIAAYILQRAARLYKTGKIKK
jgi:hypothetical protein